MIKIAALLVVVACSGCSLSAESYPSESLIDRTAPADAPAPAAPGLLPLRSAVSISEAFTADEQAGIVAAADQWREVTGGAVDLRIQIGGDAPLRIYPGDVHGAGATGVTNDVGGGQPRIMLDTQAMAIVASWNGSPGYLETVTGTAAHEIGHALGLPHAPEGLMRWNFRPMGEPIDAGTAAALCDLRDCSL